MTTVVRYRRSEPYSVLSTVAPVARPYLPVRLQYGGRFFDTLGLIDSGADCSLFNLEILSQLGLERTQGRLEPTTGLGGDAATWYFDVHLIVLRQRFLAKVGFAAELPRGFGLLGRADFFRVFQVGIDQRNTMALLHPYPRS